MGKPLKYRGFSLQSMRAIMLAHVETYKVDMYSHVDSHTHSKAKNKTKQTKIIFKKKTNKKTLVSTPVYFWSATIGTNGQFCLRTSIQTSMQC